MSDYTSVAATVKPITVAEAKSHLNVTHNEDDSLIDDYIGAATAMLEARTQRCFVTQTRVCKMDGFGDSRYVHGRTIYPPRSPLVSVSSISYLNGSGTTTTLASSDYIVQTGERPGRISEAYNATWPDTYGVENDVTVTYLAGHSTASASIPANIKQAVRMLVGHWYRNREASIVGTASVEIVLGLDALLESERVEGYA